MQIVRRKTDYGIRLLLELSRSDHVATPCWQLAKACGTPKSFTYKVLRKLASAGLVSSLEGRPGGFKLTKKPRAISLYQIVDLLQGPISVSRCVLDSAACDRGPNCPVSRRWSTLEKSVIGFLKRTTLADLLKSQRH